MFRKIFTIGLLCCFATGFSQSKLCLLPTLHGLHKSNSQYSYDSLRAVITRMHPEVIAVEMRAEDLASDTAYLKKNYPYEMWMARYWFPSATLEGFDWLGTGLEGKSIPDRYWKDRSAIKALERLLDADSSYSSGVNRCQTYTDERMAILKSSALRDILLSHDAALIKAYYDCLDRELQGSRYAALTGFYAERNRKMQERLSALIKKHPGKTIVVLTGDDHYPYLLEFLQKQDLVLVQPL